MRLACVLLGLSLCTHVVFAWHIAMLLRWAVCRYGDFAVAWTDSDDSNNCEHKTNWEDQLPFKVRVSLLCLPCVR